MSNDVKKRVPNENEKVRTIKKEITELIKPLAQALERLQALRCSVDSVFNFLQEGCSDEGVENEDRAHKTVHQQNFMQNLHDMLQDVMQTCESLEDSMKKLPDSNYQKITPPTANLATLSMDHEKVDVFQTAVHSTQRFVKIKDFAMAADRMLQQRALKRTLYPHASPSSKKMRPQPKEEPPQKMRQMLILTVQQAGMRGSVKSLGGRHNCIIVMVNRVMSVYILMRDLTVERVFARGFDEDDAADALDLYTESSYEAIKLVSTHAMAAVLFFTHRVLPENEKLQLLLSWLKSYSSLFTSSCKRCNRHLRKGLPPTWRDFHTFTAYHFECRY